MLPGPALGIEHIPPVATYDYIDGIGQRSKQFLCHEIAPGYTADDDGVLFENTCAPYEFPDGIVGAGGQQGCTKDQFLYATTNNAAFGTRTTCELQCADGFHAVDYEHHGKHNDQKHGKHHGNHHDHEHYTGIDTVTDLHCGIDGGLSTTTLVCAEDHSHSHSHGKHHGKHHDHDHGKDAKPTLFKESKSSKTGGRKGKKGTSQGITDTAKSASSANVAAVGSASAVGALAGFVGAILAIAVTQKVTVRLKTAGKNPTF